MADVSVEEFEAATERGKRLFETEPHARTARYDRKTGRLILELTNECTFAVPARLLQGLEQASPGEIEAFELSGSGYGIHWDALDADFSIAGLLAGSFGTKAHMAHLQQCAAAPLDPAKKHRA
jgi:Protein of unknown function (DUF2442)